MTRKENTKTIHDQIEWLMGWIYGQDGFVFHERACRIIQNIDREFNRIHQENKEKKVRGEK